MSSSEHRRKLRWCDVLSVNQDFNLASGSMNFRIPVLLSRSCSFFFQRPSSIHPPVYFSVRRDRLWSHVHEIDLLEVSGCRRLDELSGRFSLVLVFRVRTQQLIRIQGGHYSSSIRPRDEEDVLCYVRVSYGSSTTFFCCYPFFPTFGRVPSTHKETTIFSTKFQVTEV